MMDAPEGQDDFAASPDPAWSRRGAVIALAGLLEAVGFGGFLYLVAGGRLIAGLLLLQLVLSVGMLLLVLWAGARRRNQWSQPLSQFEALLPQVRRGDEPIESLSRISGKLRPVAMACQELLRDLRQQRSINAQLQDEMRQRVAHKTEALERTIGALRQQAARDGLTGLFNRRMLDAYLPEALERCRSAGVPLCLLMIDIDHFKPLNDTLGHAAGDQMLRTIAQLIRSTIRDRDVAFRCGGDEFVILLEADESAGRVVADRLTSLASGIGRTLRLPCPPTLSIGISSTTGLDPATPEALIHRADEELYRVKADHHRAATPQRQIA